MEKRVIFPLDVSSLEEAGDLVTKLAPHVAAFKVGMQLATAVGVPAAIKYIYWEHHGGVFLDLKFKDVKNTMVEAVRSACKQGIFMCNIHTVRQDTMRAIADDCDHGSVLIIAVTVLTDHNEQDLEDLNNPIEDVKADPTLGDFKLKRLVWKRAIMTARAGLHGVVCAPAELEMLMEHKETRPLKKVTPNIRPGWWKEGDEQNVARQMTPGDAIRAGADFLVIGRPIRKSKDPVEAIIRINEEVNEALAFR